jgi:hypothetical protein
MVAPTRAKKIANASSVRPAGLPAQHGPDGRRHRRRVAGPDLALFRAVAVSDLSVAAVAEADRAEDGGGRRRAASRRERGRIAAGGRRKAAVQQECQFQYTGGRFSIWAQVND